jgi:hypothetical protein
MAVGTMSRLVTLTAMIGLQDRFKMIWIHASTIPTLVVNVVILGNRPDVELVRSDELDEPSDPQPPADSHSRLSIAVRPTPSNPRSESRGSRTVARLSCDLRGRPDSERVDP